MAGPNIHFTTREVAALLGVEPWQVQRLFESGTLPEPPRFAGKRVISRDLLPAIVDSLRARGWLAAMESAAGDVAVS